MSTDRASSAGASQEAEKRLQSLFGEVPEPSPVQKMLGARLESVDKGQAVFTMEADEDLHNMVNVVHGGVLTSLAELAASIAVLTMLEEDEAFTFISQTTNYERPVVDGTVEAEAEMIRRGNRISFVEVRLSQQGGESARAEFTALTQPIEK